MLDCHTHVLPAIDDGAKTMEDALALVARMAELGVSDLVATPHWCSPRFQVEDQGIIGAWERLQTAVAAAGTGITLHLGAEHHLSGLQPPDAFVATVRPLGASRVVLIELPDDHLPRSTWATLFALSKSGRRPMLAHPERCKGLSASDPQLQSYIESGGLLQLTLGHLIGAHGLIMRWRTRRLLARHGRACIIASDSHDLGPRRPRWDQLPERWRALAPAGLRALEAWG